MAGLYLYTGNRLELLGEHLAQLVRAPLPSSALAPETVVVQSRGMARWVSLELARINGICANCRFPFPNAFLHEMVTRLLPEIPDAEASFFDPDVMTFRIFKRLPEYLSKPGFESLSEYLTDDDNNLRSLQLASRIANLFDQYQVFRPEMITAWDAGKDNGWQSVLWRSLSQGKKGLHRTQLRQRILTTLGQRNGLAPLLPDRVSVFGISYLPPFHLEVLAALSRVLDVHLFLVNPCREYWADIFPRTALRKKTGHFQSAGETLKDLHLEEGNRLLATLGRLGREFFSIIQNLDADIIECFHDVPDRHLLGAIQSDLLNLVDRSRPSDRGRAEPDVSIQIHAVHSPMREIEVLHDQLLAMFEEIESLLPKDVIVMAPDIETYAPFIHAVFQTQADDRLRIPYSVADRNPRRESRLLDTVSELLGLRGSRFGASEVLSLLESPPMRLKFGLSDRDLELIERWIRFTGIRWGRDGHRRIEMGLPGFEENTWKQGLERMMLGYVMPGSDRHMFRDILPFDPIEGSNAQLLGKFLECMDRLFRFEQGLDDGRTIQGWRDFLLESFESLVFSEDEYIAEMQQIRDIFDELKQTAAIAGFDAPIDFDPIRHWITQRLDTRQFSSAFISGGVTFCAMLPMRSIPFKVVCLIGMNGDAFPRNPRPLGFDLMATHPRPGDRSSREDDKYLFLEALISARDRLYISYLGQDLQDNSRIPPSVLVSELMDYLIDGYGCTEDGIVTYHPLQAFSNRYFVGDSPLFSYSEENFRASSALSLNQPPEAFISTPLTLSEEEETLLRPLPIDRLIEFYRNPARFLLKRRFNVLLDPHDDTTEDFEPFDLNGHERYAIGCDAVDRALGGTPVDESIRIHGAAGRLPHGSPGQAISRRISREADTFVRKISDRSKGTALPPLEVDCAINGSQLQGVIENIYTAERMTHRFANTRAADLVACWIYHLLLCMPFSAGYPRVSTLVCKDKIWQFAPVDRPEPILEALVSSFREGLCRPLPFFPEASYAFALDYIQRGKDRKRALDRARRIWTGNDWRSGESQDPYIHTCFRHADPIDDEFATRSGELFKPLLRALSEIK